MILITGPMWSGKRALAKQLLHGDEAAFETRCACEVQSLAAGREDLEALADELTQYEIVTASELGGGVVPVDPREREARERAGRLACLLAARADTVIRVFWGLAEESRRVFEALHAGDLPAARKAVARIVGRDTPLSPEGVRALRPADFSPATVYVSPLRRAVQTAQTLFPAAALVTVGDLAEMDFGDFDGRTADEMAEDPAYRAWVEQGCSTRCPNGERRAEFCSRRGRRGRPGKPRHRRARWNSARRDGALFRAAVRILRTADAFRRRLCA